MVQVQTSRDRPSAQGIPERWRRRQTRGAWSRASVSHTEFYIHAAMFKSFFVGDINSEARLGQRYVGICLKTERSLEKRPQCYVHR